MDQNLTEQLDQQTDENKPSQESTSGKPAAVDQSAPAALPASLEITVDEACLDDERFASIWNIAASTVGGDTARARALASKFLGFLCKHQSPLVVASTTDLNYLDEWFERENALLYNWKEDSEKVDVVAQHAQVPFDHFKLFLAEKKFKPDANYSPRRADRTSWFKEVWNVG